MHDDDDLKTTINPNNVTTGAPPEGGCCYTSFEEDVTLPTTASENIAAPGSKFENLGELSDGGWTQSVSTSVQKFKGYHGITLLSQVSDEENTFKVEFLEVTRSTATKLRYGPSNVTTDADGFVTGIDPTSVPDMVVPLVFDELFSNGVKQRTVYPRAKIDSIDDQPHQKGSLLVYGMTFTALPDEQGRPYYVRRAKRAVAADTRLSALTVGTLRLAPAFGAGVTQYAAETTASTVAVTAIPADGDATVEVKNGSATVANGGSASLSAGENTITVTVSNGGSSTTYTVVVTKS